MAYELLPVITRATARVARTIHAYRVKQAAVYCTGDPGGRPGDAVCLIIIMDVAPVSSYTFCCRRGPGWRRCGQTARLLMAAQCAQLSRLNRRRSRRDHPR